MSTLAMHHRARVRPRHRRVDHHRLDQAYSRARSARLSPAAIRATMQPIRHCARRLCQGVATEDEFVIFRTSMRIAQCIELHRTLRTGISGHVDAVLVACSAIHDRAMTAGAWRPVAVNFAEQDAINDMVELHQLQLQRITGGQLTDRVDALCAEAEAAETGAVHVIQFSAPRAEAGSSGGRAFNLNPTGQAPVQPELVGMS